MAFNDRVKEYQDQIAPEYWKHVVRGLRKDNPTIPPDLTDIEVLRAHRNLFAGNVDDPTYTQNINDKYAQDFEPSTKPPEPNLIEKAQIIAPQVPKIAGEMGKAMVPFAGAQAVQAIGKIPGIGPALLAANTGTQMVGEQLAGSSLEKTAKAMPEPDIQVLQKKGYSPAQIRNVMVGYTKVQQELYNEEQKIGEAGLSTLAEGATNIGLFGMGVDTIKKTAESLITTGAARAGVKAAVAGVAGKTAGHAAAGAAFGAAFGGVQSASDSMLKAGASGLGADDMWKAGLASGVSGLKTGAVLGGIIGGTIGMPLAAVSTGREIAATASAARKALAEKVITDARAVNLQKFADDFRPTDLYHKFWEELKAANEGGLPDEQLAQNIVAATQGPEVAASEGEMRAASKLYSKILTWRTTNEGLRGPMVDLPQNGVERTQIGIEQPQASITPTYTPEQQAAGLQTPGQPINPPLGLPGPGIERPQEFAPPAEVAPMEGVQPAGAAVPVPPPAPIEVQGPQPVAPSAVLNQPVAAQHLRPAVAPEIAPRELPPAPAPARQMPPNEVPLSAPPAAPSSASAARTALLHAMELSGTPEEKAKFLEAQKTPSAPKEGFASTAPVEPHPIELPAVAARVKDLPPEQAKIAAGAVTPGQPMVKSEGLGTRLGKALDTQAAAAQKRIKARGTRLYAMGLDPEAIADHSIIVAAEMFSKGMRAKNAVSNFMIQKWGEEIKPHINDIFTAAQARLVKMFKTEGNARGQLEKLNSLRASGAHGMNWYEETANWVQKEFGPDADMFLRMLAATSANSSTETGASLAMKAFGQWKNGLPFDGMRGSSVAGMLDAAVRGEEFGSDKVKSFYQALRGDKNAVVLDRWMIRALGIPTKKGSLKEGNYKLYSQIVRNLAEDAKMSPRQLQAAIWEGSRVGTLQDRWKIGGPYAASKVGAARPLEDLLKSEFRGQSPYQWAQNNRIKLEDLNKMTEGIKTAKVQGGFTFDPKTWEADKTPGYVVTLLSDNVPRKEFYPPALTKFKAQVQKLIGLTGHINIGVFDLGDYKPGHFSMDLNVVIPNTGPESLTKAKAIGKLNHQFEVGEIGPDGNYVQGHKTGYDPKVDGPQFTPPSKGAERSAWFRTAIGRARTMLDQIDFRLTPPGGKAGVNSWSPATSESNLGDTKKIVKEMIKNVGQKIPDVSVFKRIKPMAMSLWISPDGQVVRVGDHAKNAGRVVKTLGLKEQLHEGNESQATQTILNHGFVRIQMHEKAVAADATLPLTGAQIVALKTMRSGPDGERIFMGRLITQKGVHRNFYEGQGGLNNFIDASKTEKP